MNVRYRMILNEEERAQLQELLVKGKSQVRKVKRAQILLAATDGVAEDEITKAVHSSAATIYRTKRCFVEDRLDAALHEAQRPGGRRKLSGKEEALLIATACSSLPKGQARWTLDPLAGQILCLTGHDSLSRATVGRRLAENDLKPWRQKMWCVSKVDRAYGACMEDVMELYAQPPDPKRPVVCFDESPTQLVGQARELQPVMPGMPA